MMNWTTKTFKVINSFSLINEDDGNEEDYCSPAPGQIVNFKPGDIIACEVSGSNIRMTYKCNNYFSGNSGMFSQNQISSVDRNDVQEVVKCKSGYSQYDNNSECISPLARVIDNTNLLAGFLKRPFGLNPFVGWGIIGAGAIGIVYAIMSLKKQHQNKSRS